MSWSLSQAARGLASRLGRGSQLQQRRFAGDLPVKPNKHIEEWSVRREHLEKEFKWDTKTLVNIGIWAFGFPYFIYTMCVKDFDKADEAAGRPKREFWGYSSSSK